jgi:hypothetical protein
MCGKDFDGDGAVKARVLRAIDFAHAACAERRCDLIRSEPGSCGKPQGSPVEV